LRKFFLDIRYLQNGYVTAAVIYKNWKQIGDDYRLDMQENLDNTIDGPRVMAGMRNSLGKRT